MNGDTTNKFLANIIQTILQRIYIRNIFQLLWNRFSFYTNLTAAATASCFVRVVAATFWQPHEAEVAVWAMFNSWLLLTSRKPLLQRPSCGWGFAVDVQAAVGFSVEQQGRLREKEEQESTGRATLEAISLAATEDTRTTWRNVLSNIALLLQPQSACSIKMAASQHDLRWFPASNPPPPPLPRTINMSKHSGGATSNSGGASGGASGGVQVPVTSVGGNSPVKYNHLTYQHGHSFVKKTFHKPTNCHYCSELLWGLMGQGYICEGKSIQQCLAK